MQHGLPDFAAIAEKHDIMVSCEHPKLGQLQLTLSVQGHNTLFVPGGRKIIFELMLSKLLQVTGPWAKGLQVLEAADVTTDHIYYVFLGIMSQLDEDFRKNEFNLNSNTIEDICRIANKWFNELINETPESHDLYITMFVCNPGRFTCWLATTTPTDSFVYLF